MAKRKKRRSVDWFVARLMLALSIFMAFIFGVVVFATGMLPAKFLALVFVALALLIILIALLTWVPRHRVRYVLGLLLGIVFLVGLGFGIYAVNRGVNTAKQITTVSVETAEVGIYVRSEDPNDFAAVASSYTYGVLETLDRENTDEAITAISQEYGFTLAVRSYQGLPQLMEGLYAGEVDAIILNAAYLDVLEEMEGYEDVRLRLKEVHMSHVEREIEMTPSTGGQDVPEDRLQGNILPPGAGERDGEVVTDGDGMIFTVYLSGIDSRSGLIAKSRSDVNILASINTATHQAALISTPRDYYVPLSISGGIGDKLTHAGIYGVQVSMDTLAMLYNVNVDYFFRVNFSGFEDIIDALNGVNVYNEQAFTSSETGEYFPQGDNYLYGSSALAFVRERYAFASGDRQRGKNQLAVIKAVINKTMSPQLLMNYSGILSSVEGSFETSVPYSVISALVQDQLKTGTQWNVVSYSVDGSGSSAVPYSMSQSAYVMIPDETTVANAKNMIYQVYTGQTVTAP